MMLLWILGVGQPSARADHHFYVPKKEQEKNDIADDGVSANDAKIPATARCKLPEVAPQWSASRQST
jgi:hypothetical protein